MNVRNLNRHVSYTHTFIYFLSDNNLIVRAHESIIKLIIFLNVTLNFIKMKNMMLIFVVSSAAEFDWYEVKEKPIPCLRAYLAKILR